MSLERAIEIAKQIDPAIGPSLEIDRKNLSEDQLAAKLKAFFQANKKAAEMALAHPGKTPKELQTMLNENISAHVNNDFHVATFVANVLAKKADLATLARSAGRRIVLSDPRIADYFGKNPSVDKIALSKKISAAIEKILVDYFAKIKGTNLNQDAIVDELTTKVSAEVAENLHQI